MPVSIENLEGRIELPEKDKQSKFRFFIQYLLSPLLVLLVGLLFNFQLEKEKKELQQIQIAQSMLATLFSEDKFRTMATKRLMDEVIESKALKNEINNIVQDYLKLKFDQSYKKGDYESAQEILQASETMGGKTGEMLSNQIDAGRKQTLSRYEKARSYELKGFEALARNQFETALSNFKEAEKIYPDLHSVSEIRKLLESSRKDFSSPVIQKQIKQKVVRQYSWKVPEDKILQFKEQTRN